MCTEGIHSKYGIPPKLFDDLLASSPKKLINPSTKFLLTQKARKVLTEKYNMLPRERDKKLDFIINYEVENMKETIYQMDYNAFKDFTNFFSLLQNINNINHAIQSIVSIVVALKGYVRLDQTQKEPSFIKGGIQNTITILHNQLKSHFQVNEYYEEVPAIECFLNELNQIWTNLILNSIQAATKKGIISIYLRQVYFKKQIQTGVIYKEKELNKEMARKKTSYCYQVVTIEDDGPGISKNNKDKIFDPFFTTKAPGQGTGLGLGIVKNIVDKHKGFISLFSKPGATRFHIHLPAH